MKITEKEYSEYTKILKKYQQMRRNIIKAHNNFANTSKAPSRLPQLVAPERERKLSLSQIRLTPRKVFNAKLRHLNKVVKEGYYGFYKDFKRQYLKLYRSLLEEEPELNPKNPEGKGYLYSDYQIHLASKEEGQFMKDYNALVRMSPYVFAYLLKTGRIPAFKKLYQQFKGEVSVEENFLGQFHKAIVMAYRFKVKDAERLLMGKDDRLNLSKSNERKLNKVIKKANKNASKR